MVLGLLCLRPHHSFFQGSVSNCSSTQTLSHSQSSAINSLISESCRRSASVSAIQSVSLFIKKSVHRSISLAGRYHQSVSQSVSPSVSQSVSQSVCCEICQMILINFMHESCTCTRKWEGSGVFSPETEHTNMKPAFRYARFLCWPPILFSCPY